MKNGSKAGDKRMDRAVENGQGGVGQTAHMHHAKHAAGQRADRLHHGNDVMAQDDETIEQEAMDKAWLPCPVLEA